ncbi:MAG TPA: GNAT family N-acetyltransferase [Candidatus Binatia bacterium]|nr:GNAT family N-acetyltransferase [Candidatus Binatia bacterium]
MIAQLSRSNEASALEYLSREPILNVFLDYVIVHDTPARKNVAVVLDGDRVDGVIHSGRSLVVAAEPRAIGELAEYLRRRRGERMIVGPRDQVRALWERMREWHDPPRLVRDRQLVMAVDRASLRPYERLTEVRYARIDESNAIADGSAEMVRQELDYDPRRGAPEFRAGIRQMIERRLWWVGTAEGRICFLCNIGPWSEKTIQLQGIWTPPELRGRGLATASLAAICDRLLEVAPVISLYVNDFNDTAIALYDRVGFDRTGEFQTLLF